MCPLFSSLSRPDRLSRLAFYDPLEKKTIFQNGFSHVGRSKRLNDIFGRVWQDLKLKYFNISIIAAVTAEKG